MLVSEKVDECFWKNDCGWIFLTSLRQLVRHFRRTTRLVQDIHDVVLTELRIRIRRRHSRSFDQRRVVPIDDQLRKFRMWGKHLNTMSAVLIVLECVGG